MSLYAKIITDDKRFERMLSLELEDRGIEILEDVVPESRRVSQANFFTVVDLDFCSGDDLLELSSCSRVIGFSHSYQDSNDERYLSCHAILHRPFSMEELFSVIFNGGTYAPIKRNASPIKRGGRVISDKKGYLKLDHASKRAIWDNEGISLTDSEYKVLSILCDKRGEVVSRGEISTLLGAGEGNICDVYICMLRRKIDNRFGVRLIHTVRGEGYTLKN